MSILDDAIREHLELKRAHGADESELKRLEDEAFGPPGRPDEEANPFAEAPTEFLGAAATEVAEAPEGESGRRMPNLTDLQEPPPFPTDEPPTEEPVAEAPVDAPSAPEPPADADAEPAAEVEPPGAPEPPAEEQHPAMEHETIPAPEAPEAEVPAEPEPAAPPPVSEPVASGPSTEEREIIADQPTQFFDVEAELQAEGADASEQRSPTDEQLLDSQLNEPRLAPVEPIAEEDEEAEDDEELEDDEVAEAEEVELADEPSDEYEEDDFFSEQRLSDELNQALEAPVTDEHEALPGHEPFHEPEPSEPETPAPLSRTDEPTAIFDFEGAAEEDESDEDDAYEPEGDHEDVLEGTPEFLEDAPDDDDLWFEQRPPKDFDFDD